MKDINKKVRFASLISLAMLSSFIFTSCKNPSNSTSSSTLKDEMVNVTLIADNKTNNKVNFILPKGSTSIPLEYIPEYENHYIAGWIIENKQIKIQDLKFDEDTVITPYWNPTFNKYNIYDATGEKVDRIVTEAINDSIYLHPNVIDGYEFLYFKCGDFTFEAYEHIIIPEKYRSGSENNEYNQFRNYVYNVYPIYDHSKFTITFENNIYPPISLFKGDEIKLPTPENPAEFVGWYCEQEKEYVLPGTKYDYDNSITLTPKYFTYDFGHVNKDLFKEYSEFSLKDATLEEKIEVVGLLEKYGYENFLTGISLYSLDGYTNKLNINSCDEKEWIRLFGINGDVFSNKEDDYWLVEPALSNHDFLRAIDYAIDREGASNLVDNSKPTCNYFDDLYVTSSIDSVSYNSTEAHKKAVEAYFKEDYANYGYNEEKAVQLFKKAAEKFIEDGIYKKGDIIEIELAWYNKEQADTLGVYIATLIKDAFDKANTGINLRLTHWYSDGWENVYYSKMFLGRYDIAIGGATSDYDNLLGTMKTLESKNPTGFTLNFGQNTNDPNNCIEYKGKYYTFDALCDAGSGIAYVNQYGMSMPIYEYKLTSFNYFDNKDMVYRFDYGFLKNNGMPIKPFDYIEIVSIQDNPSTGYLKLIEGKHYVVDYEKGVITVTLSENEYKDLYGKCYINFAHQVEGEEGSYFGEVIYLLIPRYLDYRYSTDNYVSDVANQLINIYGTESTKSNYKLPTEILYESNYYDIEWTLEVLEGNPNNVSLTKDELSSSYKVNIIYDKESNKEDTVYMLTALIKDKNGNELVQKIKKVIPTFEIMTHQEYLSCEDDSVVNVEGYIVGVYPLVNGKTSFFIQSNQGEGYYVFKISVNEEQYNNDLIIGNRLIVSGTKDSYNGTHEIVYATYELLEEDGIVEPYDITELFMNAESISDETLLNLQGSFVTIKDVTLTTLENNGILNFVKDGKESYIRISSSGNCSDYDPTANDTLIGYYETHSGQSVDITGIVAQINGMFYIMPTSKDSIKVEE